MYDYAVIGGGIIGLATAHELTQRFPKRSVTVLEKEADWGQHQTGHNSGVIHAGIYYAPGSLKARLGVAGNASMTAFCREHDIPHEICGKVIVAVDDSELSRLRALHERGAANGVELTWMTADEIRSIEPHVACVAGIWSPSTGIVDFRAVCRRLARLAEQRGADLRLSTPVTAMETSDDGVDVQAPSGPVKARFAINCAGLHSDRLARRSGLDPGAQIVPFRGEYYKLTPAATSLVRSLIYPVPDPDFPFLGVHLTRMLDGSVHAGPNAVLATAREGYRRTDFRARDVAGIVAYRGFWRLAARHLRQGAAEAYCSVVRRAFVKRLRRLVPELGPDDVVRAENGVRAQALMPDGRLADDFLIVSDERSVHVCNAPSPAATAALEIARHVVDQLSAATPSRKRS